MSRMFKIAIFSLVFNIAYGIYNIVVGVSSHSYWLLTIGVYYIILSLTRYAVLRTKENKDKLTLKKFTGVMLVCTSLPLAGMVVLASVKDRGIVFHQIVMITIALYTFTKITLATVNLVKTKSNPSHKVITLRNISFADAFVSVFSLQRSMLVSFGGMDENGIRIMNIATGSAVCIIVFLLGLNLAGKLKFKKRKAHK